MTRPLACRSTRLALAAAALALLAGALPARTAGAEDAVDAAAIERTAPAYPPRALAYGVDTDVEVLVRADEEGNVSQVKLTGHKADEWGFAEAARAAVEDWKFRPAVVDGQPVPRVYRTSIRFRAERPRSLARLYPQSSAAVYRELEALVKALGLPLEVSDDEAQVLVTADVPLADLPPGFPELDNVGTADWRYVQLHLFVSPWVEPARVQCNARLSRIAGDYVTAAIYSEGTAESWLLDRLDERLDTYGRDVPLNPARRVALSEELAAPAASSPQPFGRVLAPGDPAFEDVSPARLIAATRFPAVDPTRPRPRASAHSVQLEAVIHEDGVVSIASVLSSPTDGSPQLVTAAAQAARLWRFRPARLEGRPVAVATTLTIDFPATPR